jgi:hypothetical protein
MKPGEEIINQGLTDLAEGIETIPSLLVLIGAPRLQRLGVTIPPNTIESPEHRLYEVLRLVNPDSAHSQYNALIRRLVSFERAAECSFSLAVQRVVN